MYGGLVILASQATEDGGVGTHTQRPTGRLRRLARSETARGHNLGRHHVQAIGRQPDRALDGAPIHRLVHQHAATDFAQAEAAAGADLPQFVKDELDAFLKWGILALSFLGIAVDVRRLVPNMTWLQALMFQCRCRRPRESGCSASSQSSTFPFA